jgi:hypothetical protein
MTNETAQYVVPIMEFLLAIAGMWTLYLTLKALKQAAPNPSAAWKRLIQVLIYAVCAVTTLTLAMALGERSAATLLLVLGLPGLLVLVAFGLALRATRHARKSAEVEVSTDINSDLVVIQSIVPDRIRGFDDKGEAIYLSEEDMQALVGSSGHVRMLPFAGGHTGPKGAPEPLFGFWNDQGTSVLLYKDDVLGVTGGAA